MDRGWFNNWSFKNWNLPLLPRVLSINIAPDLCLVANGCRTFSYTFPLLYHFQVVHLFELFCGFSISIFLFLRFHLSNCVDACNILLIHLHISTLYLFTSLSVYSSLSLYLSHCFHLSLDYLSLSLSLFIRFNVLSQFFVFSSSS